MDEFSTRLYELFDYLKITHVELAEKMGIQRTSFNHLLSGRNKPGFEFWVKLHSCYPQINLNWLIAGTGTIVENADLKISPPENKELETHTEVDLFSNIFNQPPKEPLFPPVLAEEEEASKKEPKERVGPTAESGEIDRLIIVYANGKMVEIKQ